MDQIEFINKIKDAAIETQKEYKIFASVTIAQAILESGWGESSLAKNYNNLLELKRLGIGMDLLPIYILKNGQKME